MGAWVNVARLDEFEPGSRKVILVDELAVAVFNINGRLCAIEDLCTHDGGELASGTLEGDEIVCPRHGARFSVCSGACLAAPAYEPVTALPVRVQDGMIQVRDDRWD